MKLNWIYIYTVYIDLNLKRIPNVTQQYTVKQKEKNVEQTLKIKGNQLQQILSFLKLFF